MGSVALARWTALGLTAMTALSVGCLASQTASAAHTPQQTPVTFTEDVAPILIDRCGTCHHPEGPAPFSLVTYPTVKSHATQMLAAIKSGFMPPWKSEPGYGEFVGQRHVTVSEMVILERWIADGAREGDPRKLPVRQWTQGWQLGKPDLIAALPAPFVLPAEGVDVSRVFVFRLPVSAMRYVRGLEFRPGNAKVVHHANIRIDRTPASRQLDDQDSNVGYDGLILRSAVFPDGHFLGWTPGQVAPLLPRGLAWRLDPGTDLVVEIHMQPSGKTEVVDPSIGLYFTGDAPERTPVMLRLGRQSIDIAQGDANYIVTDAFTLPVDVEVQAVQPHAHYRAREVVGSATLPDGSTKSLIYIKDWDVRWQHVYRLVEPLVLPRGTTVAMRYRFDNSTGNSRNPQQPPVRVSWGQFSRDEMGDLWIQVLTRDEGDRRTLTAAFRPKLIAEDVAGYETMIRGDGSKVSLHDDVGALYLELGRVKEAVEHFERSAALAPGSAAAHYNLATTLTLAGSLNAAIDHFQRAIAIRPNYALAQNNLGGVLLRLGRVEAARERFLEAIRLDAGYAEAHYNLGSLFRARQEVGEAIAVFRRAVQLKPDFVPAVAALASLLATAEDASLRDPGQAIRLAEHAVDLTGRSDAAALDVLAAALASSGQFDRAVQTATEALALRPSESLATAIRERQQHYVQRRAPDPF